MSRTANLFAQIEPDLKEDSESILNQLCIPMSNTIALDSQSVDEFNAEIEKGYKDMKEGKVRPASDVFADLQKDYSL